MKLTTGLWVTPSELIIAVSHFHDGVIRGGVGKSQQWFFCNCCGHVDNADIHAAEVMKKKAIKIDSGTELVRKVTPVLTYKGVEPVVSSLAPVAVKRQ